MDKLRIALGIGCNGSTATVFAATARVAEAATHPDVALNIQSRKVERSEFTDWINLTLEGKQDKVGRAFAAICVVVEDSDGVIKIERGNIDSLTEVESCENRSFAVLGLPPRVESCLRRNGIEEVADLLHKSLSDLEAIPRLGSTGIWGVTQALEGLGLSLRDDD